MTISELQRRITEWHIAAFPWANSLDCLIKLSEENAEAMKAQRWSEGNLADELADCAISVIAAAGRAGINLEKAIEKKFPEVIEKHRK